MQAYMRERMLRSFLFDWRCQLRIPVAGDCPQAGWKVHLRSCNSCECSRGPGFMSLGLMWAFWIAMGFGNGMGVIAAGKQAHQCSEQKL